MEGKVTHPASIVGLQPDWSPETHMSPGTELETGGPRHVSIGADWGAHRRSTWESAIWDAMGGRHRERTRIPKNHRLRILRDPPRSCPIGQANSISVC